MTNKIVTDNKKDTAISNKSLTQAGKHSLMDTADNLSYPSFLDLIYTRFSGNVSYKLERVIDMMKDMDNPEAKIKGIHIAGTNGKGSTAAMCEAIALADNKTTGLNTSPHLLDYCERFRINGRNLAPDELITTFLKWQPVFEKWQASFFEITTAIAFQLFLEKKIETSIFEVGLGGRLDATNPFNASVTIITGISLDHKKTLGDSIEKIAYEKAGIIKHKVPLVLGKLVSSALKVIKEVALEKQAPCFIYGEDYYVENVCFDNHGTTFDLNVLSEDIPLPRLMNKIRTNMIGQHQARNAALSMVAYSLYKKYLNERWDLNILGKGLNNVNWLGRMQKINSQPLTILDCAHNEEGIENLVVNLKQLYPNRKILFVVAILRDKNFRKMVSCMGSIAKKIYIAKNSSQRAADPQEQAAVTKESGIPCSIGSSVIDAYHLALEEAGKDDIIIITGSIYTVSEILPVVTAKTSKIT